MKRVYFILLALLMVISVAVVGCPPAEEPPPEEPPLEPQYGGIVRGLRSRGPASDFGIPWKVMAGDKPLANPSQESLVRLHLNGTIEPVLATSWSIAPDYRSITYYLREGVKFHDGSSWNASVAKWNLDKQWEANRPGTELFESVDVIGPYTVRVNLKGWSNMVFECIAAMYMLSQVAWETLGEAGVRFNPIGTGAFKLVSNVPDVGARYEKFDDYWREGLPYLDGVWLPVVADPLTQAAMMTAGEADILWSPNYVLQAMLRDAGFEIIYFPYVIVSLVPSSNTTTSPFHHKKVREAAAHAVNWTAITRTLGYRFLEPVSQFALPYQRGYNPNFVGYTYDPAKARTLLDEAGYPAGEDGVRFRTTIHAFPGFPSEILVAIKSYLDAVGISTTIATPAPPAFAALRYTTGWEGLLALPLVMYDNINRTFMLYVHTDGGDLISMRRPPGLESLIEESVGTPEIDVTKVRAILQLVHDDVTLISAYGGGAIRSVRPGVHDVFMMETYSDVDIWAPEFIWMEQ